MTEQPNNGEQPQTSLIGEMIRPGEMESIPELLEFVASIERQKEISEARIKEIEVALKEILATIVKYSYSDRKGNISITCRNDHWGKLMVIIINTGEPFNILLSDVTFIGEESPVDNEKKASAKLIKKMLDNIEFKKVEEENIVTFLVSNTLRTVKRG
ncbi:MAG: hypothetical protein A4E57_01243 [Syntrophorhabdaceae bacterium PtaU1.Bin034]|jgi:anti-sigma regulatory factor (Ser/Thr protein kinase)|nr:MAG: hypothetical protein A4E57_01243 [Syntrophorhabdaceae bacterium PtaU1.Bin034]